jgi:hypothetical protein
MESSVDGLDPASYFWSHSRETTLRTCARLRIPVPAHAGTASDPLRPSRGSRMYSPDSARAPRVLQPPRVLAVPLP